MLHAVLEEAERAVVKVEQHAHTIAQLAFACLIVTWVAVAVEATIVSVDEPAIGAVTAGVVSSRVEVGPADADEDHVHTPRQQLHLQKCLPSVISVPVVVSDVLSLTVCVADAPPSLNVTRSARNVRHNNNGGSW